MYIVSFFYGIIMMILDFQLRVVMFLRDFSA